MTRPSPLFSYFPWLAVSLKWLYHYILPVIIIIYIYVYIYIYPGKSRFLFLLSPCSLWFMQMLQNIKARRSYLFVCTLHFLISIILQAYPNALTIWNACQVYSAEWVSKIISILSIIFHAIYGTVRFQLMFFSCDNCENMCTYIE